MSLDANPSQDASELSASNDPGLVVRSLADLPADSLLDETALAAALQISSRTVRRMVGRFELPPPFRFAGRSTWFAGRVLEWVRESAERVEREAKKKAQTVERFS